MPHHTHIVRVTHGFAKVKAVIALWAMKCDKILVYEHREEGKKLHIHLLLEGCTVDKKQLRNLAQETMTKEAFKGNENMSFRAKDTDNIPRYITYMTKGVILGPEYNKGYDLKYLEERRLAWVAGDKVNPWQLLWEAYQPHMIKPQPVTRADMEIWLKDETAKPPPTNTVTYKEVCSHVYGYLMHKSGGIFRPQMKTEQQSLVRTYCWKFHITIPTDKDKMNLV